MYSIMSVLAKQGRVCLVFFQSRFPMVVLVWALAFVEVSCMFSQRACQKMYDKAAKAEPYDMVVVPGVPFENGQWSMVMRGRVLWAKYLYDNGIAKNIMFSGSAVYTPYVEAEIMKLYAISLGVPADHLFVETKAEHSTENIYYGYKKSQSLGFKRVALASDPFQAKMLRRFIKRRLGREVGVIPFVFTRLETMHSQADSITINPATAFKENFVSILVREGFWLRFRGTRGLRCDETAYPVPQ